MGPLKVGTTLSDKYKIDRLLAESGGVILYEATDTARSKRVWVKILQRDAMSNAATLARFQRESTDAKVLDVGKSDGLPYMVAAELGAATAPAPAPKPRPGAPGVAAAASASAFAGKTTLPGVAPPPPPVPREAVKVLTTKPEEAEEAAPSSGIPLLDEDVLVSDSTPPPPIAPEAKVILSPSLAPLELPVLTSPVITTVPNDEPAPAAEPPPRKEASLRRTVLIEGRGRAKAAPAASATGKWVTALVVVSSLTGIGGWYLGRHGIPRDGATSTTATAATATATTTATETASATAPLPTTTTTDEPSANAQVQASATSEPSAAPSASVEPAPTLAAAATTTKPSPAPAPTHTHTSRPAVRKPPTTTSHPASGDPLTL